ncbi:shikimate kinase [Longilinea arvoryzae]|uniref:Shikimate kinase n=1 Tax=Longilinea arvoryzae TaxID=360412 RepID=A0A0S7BDB5_9CHLR|nr:shikimate kinase [Longilinea arvoryzae]GAP12784.1 shikimate kinase [Longilinea arvoryzae]
MSTTNSEIILIGPVRTGKSTLGKLLSETLGKPQVSLDNLRRNYYQEIGYDEKLAESFRQHGGFLALFLYWNLFDAYAIERMLADHHNCIFDLGAGNGVSESRESLIRIQRALSSYPNIFLILPSPDLEESLQILKSRDKNPPVDLNFDFNRHFLENGAYFTIAKHIVFTKGKLPEETGNEILALVVH